jgi:hypothetical protein
LISGSADGNAGPPASADLASPDFGMGGGGGGISGIDVRDGLGAVDRWLRTSGGGSGGSSDNRGWRESESLLVALLIGLDSELGLDSFTGSGMGGISNFFGDALIGSSFSAWTGD